jgi:uracil-DNA glycosylase
MTIIDDISNLRTDWKDMLLACTTSENISIDTMLTKEDNDNNTVYPEKPLRFVAFSLFNVNELKVVLIGQDPYHGVATNGHPLANGFCFSVPHECGKCPSSLKTVFKEIEHEYGVMRTNTDLLDWAQQGVLLLNCALTVRANKPNSHMKVWKPFTETVLRTINERCEGVVYILWGEFAKSLGKLIDKNKNCILECRHPSGLAASKGPLIGNNHFKMANEYLESVGKECIKWV